ncbi:MAG TPA: SDR family NAD(P)-dependent oxidoreductase, partial [Variovorax sp.]|nr:SDR family NAD(P)-dependent oxidoreductase [Variovorax sp.]
MRVKDKVAIITGAGAGIGRASAELFAREGARVLLADVNVEAGETACEAIVQAGGSCLFVPTDVSQPVQMQRLVETAIQTHGRLDILYNNAGGSTAQDGPVTTAPH